MRNKLTVELQTPHGVLLDGVSEGVELQTTDGTIEIRPGRNPCLSLIRSTEITLRMGGKILRYSLENAAAGLRDGHLTIIAETARQLAMSDAEEPEPA